MKQSTRTIFTFIALTATSSAFLVTTTPTCYLSRGRNAVELFYAKDSDTIRPESMCLNQEQLKNKKRTRHDISWYESFEELRTYYKIHGHADVPYSFPNKRLVRWVTNQRQTFKTGIGGMKQDRIDALNSIGFSWETRSAWSRRFGELSSYYNTHGHLNIREEENLNLARFVSSQRHQYKLRISGEKSPMTDERLEALLSIGFQFHVAEKKRYDSFEWRDQFEKLRIFHDENGHVDVTREDHSILHSWLQQQIKDHEDGRLDGKRQKILEELGVKFASEYGTSTDGLSESEIKWNSKFEELREYSVAYGDCMVPQHYEENPPLGLFVKNQRRQYKLMKMEKKSSMTKERVEKLESIGFVWNTRDYCPENDPSDVRLLQIPVRLALKRSLDKRRSKMSQKDVEENAELLLEKYKRISEWGI